MLYRNTSAEGDSRRREKERKREGRLRAMQIQCISRVYPNARKPGCAG